MFNPFELYTLPLDDWVEAGWEWLRPIVRPFFQVIRWPVAQVLNNLEDFLLWLPPLIFLAVLFLVAWRVAGWRVALFSLIGMAFVGFLQDAWTAAMTTLALVATAVLFCALVGIPLGIIASRSNVFEAAIRPVLDAMQTVPAFVYLVPIVMLFGVGLVPGVIATIIFAIPPLIRLTNLGIRQVQREVVEAAYAFGSTPWQVLWEIQLPLAVRTIMAGLNQTLMLALSMVVIAAMIGAGGLGMMVRVALGRVDIGLGAIGGIGIVILAIILDRITQAMGQPSGQPGLLSTLKDFFRLRRPLPAQPGGAGASSGFSARDAQSNGQSDRQSLEERTPVTSRE